MMHLIKATDPADLTIQVNEQIKKGQDLYTSPFVSDEGLICQRTVKSLCVYEYHLIIAKDLDDLYQKENDAIEMGFDYIFNTVMWNAKYLQWMSRLNSSGLTIRDAALQFSTKEAASLFENAPRADELQLVVDVREALHMEPTALGGYVVSVPYPVMGS